jgi:hypothetical protein
VKGTDVQHRALMLDLIETKIRIHAQQFYEERGQIEGHALEDWLKAECEVLKTSILAPLWHSRRTGHTGWERVGPMSYDSGYEHSLEHWLDVRRLVDEAEPMAHRDF